MTGRRNRGCGASRGGAGLSLLAGLAVLGAVAALAWMLLVPVVFARQLSERTGFGVGLRSLTANPLTGSMELRGLVLTNPPAFATRDFLRVREMRVDADLTTVLSGRPVFDEVVLDIEQLALAETAGGTNAEKFHSALATGGASPGATPRYLIRRLRLRLDRVTIAETAGGTPATREVALGLDRRLTAVTDLQPLLPPEAWQSLAPLGAALSGLMPGDLERALRDAAHEAAERMRRAGQRAGEKARGLAEALEESKKP